MGWHAQFRAAREGVAQPRARGVTRVTRSHGPAFVSLETRPDYATLQPFNHVIIHLCNQNVLRQSRSAEADRSAAFTPLHHAIHCRAGMERRERRAPIGLRPP